VRTQRSVYPLVFFRRSRGLYHQTSLTLQWCKLCCAWELYALVVETSLITMLGAISRLLVNLSDFLLFLSFCM
jgi:hypothetical protein